MEIKSICWRASHIRILRDKDKCKDRTYTAHQIRGPTTGNINTLHRHIKFIRGLVQSPIRGKQWHKVHKNVLLNNEGTVSINLWFSDGVMQLLWRCALELYLHPYRKPTNASNDHFIVMSSQMLLHVSAYQRHHRGAHMILTSYLYVGVHYKKNNEVSNNIASVSVVTLWKWVVMVNCCWKQWTVDFL
jgi:hypothetical protein